MGKLKTKINFSTIAYCVAILIFECCYFLPAVQLYLNITYISILSFAFSYISFNNELRFGIIPKFFLYSLPFLLLHCIVGYEFDWWMGFLHPLLLLWFNAFPAFFCYMLLKRDNKAEIYLSVVVFILILVFVSYNTIQQLIQDENFLRLMTSGAEGEDFNIEMALNNCGGFGFTYAVGALAIGILAIFVNVKLSKPWRVVLIALYLLLLYLVVRAQFSTLLLLVLYLSIFVFFIKSSKNIRILIITFSPFLFILLPYLVDMMTVYYSNSVTGEHLEKLSSSLMGETDLEAMAGERSRYQIASVKEWLLSPLWGQSVIDTQAGLVARKSHSVILANLIEAGLIGVYFKYRSIIYATTYMVKDETKIVKTNIFLPVLLYYLILLILNPIEQVGDIVWLSFFFFPLLLNVVVSKRVIV